MKPFDDEVAQVLIHYHDVARAHSMDRALREAVGSNVFTRRECAGLRRRVEELEAERDALKARFSAPIVCMCGSTRFKQTWIRENARLTSEGYIVLSVGLWGHHERVAPPPDVKAKLDELHKRKIDLCDWVWVLDVGGYIGESTKSEIAYAQAHGKPVRYLSREFPDYQEPVDEAVAERDALRARLAESEAQAARMREVLQDALPAEESGWWCPTCKREVPGQEVTFEERHEVCGTHIGTVSSNEWRRRAKAAIASDPGRGAEEP